jgi:hypothetical protein
MVAAMARAIALAAELNLRLDAQGSLRMAAVCFCALALICAGHPLPL